MRQLELGILQEVRREAQAHSRLTIAMTIADQVPLAEFLARSGLDELRREDPVAEGLLLALLEGDTTDEACGKEYLVGKLLNSG